MRLLLVEDNARLATLITGGLRKEGFVVDAVSTVADGKAALQDAEYSVIVVDLGLPDGDGLEIVEHARVSGARTPILILTARQSVGDRVKGLQRGADDYLGKPFAFEELVARVRALLRRPDTFIEEALRLGRLNFTPSTREITFDETSIALSPRESTVLEALMRRSNGIVAKDALEAQLYGFADEGSANAVEVAIHRLRKQLVEANANVVIHTVRGVGYSIRMIESG